MTTTAFLPPPVLYDWLGKGGKGPGNTRVDAAKLVLATNDMPDLSPRPLTVSEPTRAVQAELMSLLFTAIACGRDEPPESAWGKLLRSSLREVMRSGRLPLGSTPEVSDPLMDLYAADEHPLAAAALLAHAAVSPEGDKPLALCRDVLPLRPGFGATIDIAVCWLTAAPLRSEGLGDHLRSMLMELALRTVTDEMGGKLCHLAWCSIAAVKDRPMHVLAAKMPRQVREMREHFAGLPVGDILRAFARSAPEDRHLRELLADLHRSLVVEKSREGKYWRGTYGETALTAVNELRTQLGMTS